MTSGPSTGMVPFPCGAPDPARRIKTTKSGSEFVRAISFSFRVPITTFLQLRSRTRRGTRDCHTPRPPGTPVSQTRGTLLRVVTGRSWSAMSRIIGSCIDDLRPGRVIDPNVPSERIRLAAILPGCPFAAQRSSIAPDNASGLTVVPRLMEHFFVDPLFYA
jgi:hypothetical protein